MNTEKKTKKVKELFVQDLEHVQGGTTVHQKPPKCPDYTTLACGEEANGCSGC